MIRMNRKKAMSQLVDLIADRKSFINGDKDTDKFYEADIAAIIYLIRENKILRKKILEMEHAKNGGLYDTRKTIDDNRSLERIK